MRIMEPTIPATKEGLAAIQKEQTKLLRFAIGGVAFLGVTFMLLTVQKYLALITVLVGAFCVLRLFSTLTALRNAKTAYANTLKSQQPSADGNQPSAVPQRRKQMV